MLSFNSFNANFEKVWSVTSFLDSKQLFGGLYNFELRWNYNFIYIMLVMDF
jgi:hypothetical protein